MMEDKRKLDDKELEQVSGGVVSGYGDGSGSYKDNDSNNTEVSSSEPSTNGPQEAGTYYITL